MVINELLVFCFGDEYEADEVHTTLLKMRHDHLVDLEDAIVARRNQNGDIKFRVIHHFSTSGVAGGAMESILKIVTGSLFLTPIFELVVDEGGENVDYRILNEIGISNDFIHNLASILSPGYSALFVLALHADPKKIIEELKPFKGAVLTTTLIKDESVIKAVLEQ